MNAGRHHHRHGGTATVSIHVRDPAQLFNSLDPSPFWDRDLDRDAATFIEDEFAERPGANSWHLQVHVLDGEMPADHLQQAVENYYGRLENSARRELREHRRLGELALVGGIAIFLMSMGLRHVMQSVVVDLSPIIDEGLIILGWLALWRPTEVLIYEWVPIYRKRRLYERLGQIQVAIRAEPAHHANSHAAERRPRNPS